MNWTPKLPITEWNSIDRELRTGRVIDLSLFGMFGLGGEIPVQVVDLTELTELGVSFSKPPNGEIPETLGNLSGLTRLNLLGHFTGEIPDSLGNLSNLKELSLGSVLLFGNTPVTPVADRDSSNPEVPEPDPTLFSKKIPPALGNLTNLEELNLSGNNLKGEIPKELGRLSNLKEMSLQVNQLSGGIPIELAGLFQLEELNLAQNRLTGPIPASLLAEMTELRVLDLSNNRLTGEIPATLGQSRRFERIRLSGNEWDGCIPTALRGQGGDLTKLGVPFCNDP